MLHHFFESHAIEKQKILLHADNCVGQNKNNILMQYLMWRIMSGRSEYIEISFMLVGHTKFAPDIFFGLIKKGYKHTFVSTLEEVQDVVRKSMLTGKNISQLTKSVDGTRFVFWYDWKSFLSAIFNPIPNITSYHHFRFEKKSPGVAFVRELVTSPEKAIRITSRETLNSHALPEQVTPKRMNITRKWYLFDEIARFCSSPSTASITCPRPSQPKPSATAQSESRTSVDNSAQDGVQRRKKRACSHCHLEGHTKTKKGKIICPALLQK